MEALTAFDASADPNTVHNVLLVDVLTADAAFASADPRADYKGDEYTWNLGSIPPMKSVTATMVLTVPASVAEIVALDTGATAWGTLAGEMVSASACPATLAPASLGEYLAPTVDADFHDADVARRAGQLCPNPTDAFEYVRALGYEAYKGSLRGARGTEWSQAGNSLDQANLLLATLRGNGVPARYRHGTLSTERAQELILSMFPTTGAVVGQVPDGVEVSDPANDPELLAEVRDHWWVEAYVDGSWVAMDPAFSYAELGQTFAPPSPPCEGGAGGECAEIPDGARHKVTVSVEIEKYDMLSYLSSGFGYTTPLSHTFTTAGLVGQPLTLEHLTSHETPPMGYLIYGWTYYT
ncbi:MAG TPA: transglutaminase family protein, partial [Chloroflexi bacterium]|nr:transglutaminase family protein [Chloroflexota bacterium]